jgi:hypothetical protein
LTLALMPADAHLCSRLGASHPHGSPCRLKSGCVRPPALRGLLFQSLAVGDLCKTASQQAAAVPCASAIGSSVIDRQQQLEVIVSLLERVPILVDGAVPLAEVMAGLVQGDDGRANGVIPEAAPGSNAKLCTAAAAP